MADLPDRIRARCLRDPSTGCLEWQGARNKDGYGVIGVGHKTYLAHRAVVGAEAGTVVRHTCDNPPCCEEDHLLIGTHADNVSDTMSRGRHRTSPRLGAAHGRAKLTAEQVIAIRADPRPTATIALDYAVGQPHISSIKRRKAWTHL